jgi:hypothetical protein
MQVNSKQYNLKNSNQEDSSNQNKAEIDNSSIGQN